MKAWLSRRQFNRLLQLATVLPFAGAHSMASSRKNFRIRTITAGLHMDRERGLDRAEDAVAFLRKAREVFQDQGYEVQTLRLATQPLPDYRPDWNTAQSVETIQALDQFATENQVSLSIGPVISADVPGDDFAAWAVEVLLKTRNTSFSASMASAGRGVYAPTLESAAEAMLAIAKGTLGGEGNFRFAANAYTPAGTPFFPAAWYEQGEAFSIGLESPNLLREAFRGADGIDEAKQKLKAEMEAALAPVAALAGAVAEDARWQYLGIDTSPAPGLDASIGEAIEMLTGVPFGSSSTLAACAAITEVLKGLNLKTCGYSGLMLPVMEDTVLAQRAAEERYTVRELLLYSSVCGTGLDVVPIPGDTPQAVVAALLGDVAALAERYQKPLSARLFPVPGKKAGEIVSFDNPHLTDSVIMPVG